jgi:hypothetical protein
MVLLLHGGVYLIKPGGTELLTLDMQVFLFSVFTS